MRLSWVTRRAQIAIEREHPTAPVGNCQGRCATGHCPIFEIQAIGIFVSGGGNGTRISANHVSGADVGVYQPQLRFEVAIDTDVEPVRWEVATASDGVIPFTRLGALHLPTVGDLDVWWLESYGGGVFVPVKDALAGTRTYGGGRYLLDTVKGADLGGDFQSGWLVVDLNFAYNPSCAYSPLWTCPLAPAGNTVGAALPAGELTGVPARDGAGS